MHGRIVCHAYTDSTLADNTHFYLYIVEQMKRKTHTRERRHRHAI